jgi:hypothetical protein
MPVGIPSANPAYSIESVLQAQLQGLTEPGPPPNPTALPAPAPDAAPGPSSYNFLGSVSDSGAQPGQLPAAPSDASTQGAPATPGTLNAAIGVQGGATQGSTNSSGVSATDAAAVTLAALSRGNTDAGHLSSFISQSA